MRVFLDDSRETPEGWIRTYTVEETIEMLKTESVVMLSLDHHLGTDSESSGDDLLAWLEEAVTREGFRPPDKIEIHSGDSEARVKMEVAVKRIQKLWKARGGDGQTEDPSKAVEWGVPANGRSHWRQE